MKLTIKSNGKILDAKIIPHTIDGELVKDEPVYSVEMNFEPSTFYSDLELWLEDDDGNFLDHLGVNITKRNKMQAHK